MREFTIMLNFLRCTFLAKTFCTLIETVHRFIVLSFVINQISNKVIAFLLEADGTSLKIYASEFVYFFSYYFISVYRLGCTVPKLFIASH